MFRPSTKQQSPFATTTTTTTLKATRSTRSVPREPDDDSEEAKENPSQSQSQSQRSQMKRRLINDDDNDNDNESDTSTKNNNEMDIDDDDQIDNIRPPAAKKQKKSGARSIKLSKEKVLALPACTGSLERVELVQFMCHQFFELNFNPKINFVIGHNGSGKSAILTGIMVCLGGKAGTTGRGSSVKSLVMEGKSVGSVSVSLHNKGPDAYKPEIYGQTIIIERRLSKEGAGAYKIMDADGHTQSTRKQDLTAILDHHSISIDNPLSILTQDTSRQFLANSTSKDKYSFFAKGTLLEPLSESHTYANTKFAEATESYKQRTALLPDIKKEYEAAQLLWNEMKKFDNLEDEIAMLKQKVAWAHVEAKEAEVNSAVRRLQNAERKMAERAQSLASAEEKLQLQVEREETVKEFLQTMEGSAEPLNARFREAQAGIREIQEQASTFDGNIANAKRLITAAQQTRTKMIQRIAEETRKLGAKRAQIETLKAEMEAAGAVITQISENMELAEIEKQTIESKLSNLRATQTRLRTSIQDEDRAKQQLQNSSYDRVAAYGQNMTQVLNAIQDITRRGGWEGNEPIGPLGLSIQLKKPEYRQVIESVLGGLLRSFVVDTQRDRATLNSVFQRFNIEIDETSGMPHPRYETIYRALEIKNRVVTKQLVIHLHIERLGLAMTNMEADEMVTSGEGGRAPRNLNCVWTKDVVQIGGAGGSFQTSAKTIKAGGMPMLGVEVEHEIRHRKEVIDRLNQELVAEHELGVVNENIRKLRSDRQRSAQATGRCNHEIQRLQDSLVEEEPAQIGVFEDQKKQAEEEIEGQEMQLKGLEESKRALLQEMAGKRAEANALKNELDQIVANREAERRKLREIQEEKIRLDPKALITELEDEVSAMSETAMQVSDGVRVETEGKTTKEATLRESLRQLGSREQISANLQEKKQTYEEAREEKMKVAQLLKLLQESLTGEWMIGTLTKEDYEESQELVHMLMDKRGFNAQLLIDHSKSELDLKVDVHNLGLSQGKNKDKDPKTLSGGEKSFSTVCLLLSLWESMGNPFRALDEFDVFMDAVNRKISMQNMIRYARKDAITPCQYIFITPQDMSHVPEFNAPDVKIQKLNDPERGQTTLNFRGRIKEWLGFVT
ncbi:P-loop containing nucleoside triphosphate hydrolase protein [Rhizoclosmatium globosum]|uniref:p-loop containing nucleoside triphosphate hydrolase protein n=1 Tax=Rhizoclosmatium globosum TaxID=329046 RepID=A0A1Y2C3I6_9FUNG|nr:P-loop containing nucleoside triphosphate hydrolase protein [Rhizoclosmatium globosum]|eukprot:ORY41516.1 P-loop containing nucleoside triphosphate hydrolase protein [Rhizoclosmatium globosum]